MNSPVAFWSGVTLVVATHAYMLAQGLPENQHTYHAYLNLAGAGLIVYGAGDLPYSY